MQPLHIAFGGEGEIRTLKSAEWQGGHVMPKGDALLSGYYLNELLLALLARDDPHPGLFDVYARVVELIAGGHEALLQAGHGPHIPPQQDSLVAVANADNRA
jgi:DNA repair protein RecO (recombination protein O)